MRLSTFALAIALNLSLSSAWPWPPSVENLNAAIGRREPAGILDEKDIMLRAPPAKTDDSNKPTSTFPNDNSSGGTSSTGHGNGPTSTFPKSTGTDASAASHTTGGTSGSKTGTKTAPMTSAASIPINAAAGGISMITPAQTSATYAKIGEPITFVWNYTSVLAPPSAVDVIASNTDGVWTITSNMTVKETGSVVWNTSNEATPLPMESYTFVVYDAEAGVTAVPSPGHLSPYLGYQFAMYSPKAAVSADAYICVTCNAGITSAERQSLAVLLGTCLLTIMSFSYFSCGFLGVI